MTLNKNTPAIREKLYIFLAFVSLILELVSIIRIRPVIVDADATFGLLSFLPLSYWIGLILLIGVAVCTYLDRKLIRSRTHFVILIVLVLFLFIRKRQNWGRLLAYYRSEHNNTTRPARYYCSG